MISHPKIINLSLPKTGSSTLTRLFINHGGVHEGKHIKTTLFLMSLSQNKSRKDDIKDYFFKRQKLIKARVDSTTFMHFFQDELLEIWPEATFVHVRRNPMDWVISYINMLYEFQLSLQANPNYYLSCWANDYAKFQVPELDLNFLPKLIMNKEKLALVLDGLYYFWYVRSQKTHNTIQNANSKISTKLIDLNLVVTQLAEAAQVPISQMPVVQVSNIANKKLSSYKFIHASVMEISPSLESYKKANQFYGSLH